MNFKSVTRPSAEQTFAILRIFNGLSLIIYYTLALAGNWSEFFSSNGFISPDSFSFYPGSWLFFFWEYDTLKLGLFLLTYLLCYFYLLGIYAKVSLLFLIPIHLGFHLANPFIIHEPQQLTNLLLVILFFLPIDKTFALKRGPDFFKEMNLRNQKRILSLLLFYLGAYYFFAGIKKLPDPHWINGSAVKLLASWPYLVKENIFNEFSRIPWVSFLFSWLTIIFEIGFIFIAFSRKKMVLLFCGIFLHLGIALVLDVGQFFWAMIQWYPLLMISKSAESQGSLASR